MTFQQKQGLFPCVLLKISALGRLFFHSGFFCNASALSALVAAPSTVEAAGAWANYDLGAMALPSGRYVACLCADVDGPDSDEAL